MEVEAKFVLPNQKILKQLQEVEHLAGYVLSAGRVKEVQDQYLDTDSRHLLTANYACRRRTQPEGIVMTLKGLGGVSGALHHREELEVQLSADQPLPVWPDSLIRDRIIELIGQASLHPLFNLQQTRTVRQVSLGGQVVAELSLDEVQFSLNDTVHAYFELEIERQPAGSEADLMAMAHYLQDEWQLQPEKRSKFERALLLFDAAVAASAETSGEAGQLLSKEAKEICQRIADQENDTYNRRATALLALNQGFSTKEAGQEAGLSASQTRHWRAAYRKQGLAIFPDTVLARHQPSSPPATVITVTEAEVSEPEETTPSTPKEAEVQLPRKIGLKADDSMAEAAYKTFRFHLQRLIYHEPGTRLGEDIEELHDMRVASRRMRAAYQVYSPYLEPDIMAPYIKGLRRTGRALGKVRDLDVFWEKTAHYQETLPANQSDSLASLHAVWEKQRKVARKAMLKYLNSKQYRRFKKNFAQFLQDPDQATRPTLDKKGFPIPHRLSDVIPVTLYECLAGVQAYDEFVTAPDVPVEYLHQLRIACKRLRYALEYFREVLDPQAKVLIKVIKQLQNHLGDLQDASVASNLLRDYLVWGTWDPDQIQKAPLVRTTVIDPGVATYMANRGQECQLLINTFPQMWSDFKEAGFKDLLGEIVAKL